MQDAKKTTSMGAILLAGLVFGVAMGLFIGLQTGSSYYGFHGGFFCGAAFAFGLKAFFKVTMANPRLAMNAVAAGFDPDETVIHHGPANHFKGIEAVGGKLFLTNKRLRFRSHRFNVQAHEESYPLDEIASVEPGRTLGIVPNAVLVQMRDGRRERFVVGGRSEWVSALRRAR